MADIGWGTHANTAEYGRPFDTCQDFNLVDYEVSLEKYKDFMHASHGMIYMRTDQVLWKLYPLRGAIMMQMRFDGNIGFPGGLRDEQEAPLEVINREMQEEINLDLTKYAFTRKHYAMSHVNEKKRLVTHFFIMEVTEDQYDEIEKNVLTAAEWGIETFGVIRVPLTVLGDGFRGLPVFLANRFAGNAKEQLMSSIRQTNLIPEKNLHEILKAHEEYIKTLVCKEDIDMNHFATNSESDYDQIPLDRVPEFSHYTQASHAMIYSLDYMQQPVVLMHMRFDGFFGFPGGLRDEGETIEESLNRELKEEIGWSDEEKVTSAHHCLSHVNEKTKLSLHFYCYQTSMENLQTLERGLMSAQEYGIEVLGPVRVPVKHMQAFLQQVFIGNTKAQLSYALQRITSEQSPHA